MKCIILAAGEGKRLTALTSNKPKVMLNIANKPLLGYVIDSLTKNNIRDIIVVIGYLKDSIIEYFGNGKKYNARITYITQEKQIGTANAILTTEKYVDKDFIVVSGSSIISPEDLKLLISAKPITMLVGNVEESSNSKYYVVTTDENYVKSINKYSKSYISNIVNINAYKFSTNIFDAIKEVKCLSISEVLQYLIEKNTKVRYIKLKNDFYDLIYYWDLLKLTSKLLPQSTKISGSIEKNVILKGDVEIDEKTRIRSGCYIVGPVKIGKNCDIGPNVCIYPSTTIGNNVTIKQFSTIENSIFYDDIYVNNNSYISNSIIDSGTEIGTNFNTETADTYINIESNWHNVKNIGALIGIYTKIGNSVTIKAGKIIYSKSQICSFKYITENVSENAIVM